jgi:small GTP-binding protein
MIHKKVCLLGGFAVGKTSLVSRFVSSMFSDKYHSTVGVKVDKKPVNIDGQDVTLMLWDIYGQDDFQTVQHSQLRGMSGYLLVVDGTRRATLDTAQQLQALARTVAGDVPFVLVLNKSDLASEWDIDDAALFKSVDSGWRVVRASAKLGEGVDEAFTLLTRAMLDTPARP